jgi:hypothetical protein
MQLLGDWFGGERVRNLERELNGVPGRGHAQADAARLSDSRSVPRPSASSASAGRISSPQAISKLPRTKRCTSCTAFTS